MRQNKEDLKELGKDLVDIHNAFTDALKGYTELSSAYLSRCRTFYE